MTRRWRFARFRALELFGGKRRASVRSMSDLVCSVMWCLLGLLVPPAVAQEKPLERSFLAGMSAGYRIQLLVRSEIQGQQPVQIGAKTYVKPFLREAHGRLSWRATQHVISVSADGDHVLGGPPGRSEEHTSELQSPMYLVFRLLLEKKKKKYMIFI